MLVNKSSQKARGVYFIFKLITIHDIYLAPRKPGQTREQDEIRHRSSKLVFTMPNVRPPEVIEALKREKWINKLIKYMKKSWRVKVDPRQPDRDLDFRYILQILN